MSEREAREELKRVISPVWKGYPNEEFLVSEIMAWCQRHAPATERRVVSREEIDRVLISHGIGLCQCSHHHGNRELIDDLLTLLNGPEEKKPEWCKDWEFDSLISMWRCINPSQPQRWVHSPYNFCEFCGAPRPTEEKA